MFNKVTPAFGQENDLLVFLKSNKVLAFPCGRRRAQLTENYSIPYDPESRLNTEANNRKHSSINGYTQNFITWDAGADSFSLVIGGYLFNIKLIDRTYTTTTIGNSIVKSLAEYKLKAAGTALTDSSINTAVADLYAATASKKISSIYANILIQEVPLYSGFTEYKTSVLRDQCMANSGWSKISTVIDLPCSSTSSGPEQFYFAGLSFSTKPLTSLVTKTSGASTLDHSTFSETNIEVEGELHQKVLSIKIFDRVDTNDGIITWQICPQALLPKIEHGDTADSIALEDIYVKNVYKKTTSGSTDTIDKVPSLALKFVRKENMGKENEEDIYQMVFSEVNIKTN